MPAPETRRAVSPRVVGAALAGFVCTAVVLVASGSDRVPDGLIGAAALLLLLLAPTSEMLSRRLLVNIALVLGWLPATWWLPFSFGPVGRTGVLVSLVGGATVAAAVLGRRLLPRVGWVDLWIPVSAGASLWLTQPLWSDSSPAASLARLMGGWDHAGHFSMVYLQRVHGQLPPDVSQTDGSEMVYASYVQYVNAMITSATELRQGTQAGSALVEVSHYSVSTSIVHLFLVLMVVAGILALDGLRRRPLLTAPIVVLATTVGVLGPMGSAVLVGHLNIAYAGACAAAVVLLMGPRPDRFSVSVLAPGAGLCLASAAAWSVMAPVAGGLLLVLLLTAPHPRRQVRRHLRAVVVAGSALAAGLAMVALTTAGNDAGSMLGLGGQMVGSHLEDFWLLSAVAVALAIVGRQTPSQLGSPRRVWATHLGLSAALIGAMVGFALFQIVGYRYLSYYFWKLLLGLQVAFIGPLALAAATSEPKLPGASSRRGLLAACVLFSIAAASMYGAPHAKLGEVAAPIPLRSAPEYDQRLGAAGHLVAALELAQARTGATVTYLATEPGDGTAALSDQWFHSLLGDWTTDMENVSRATFGLHRMDGTDTFSLEDTVLRVRTILEETNPNHLVVVSPGTRESLEGRLPATLAVRTIPYEEG